MVREVCQGGYMSIESNHPSTKGDAYITTLQGPTAPSSNIPKRFCYISTSYDVTNLSQEPAYLYTPGQKNPPPLQKSQFHLKIGT